MPGSCPYSEVGVSLLSLLVTELVSVPQKADPVP